MRKAVQAILLFGLFGSLGCAEETPGSVDTANDLIETEASDEVAEPKGIYTYYVSNPTSGGCANALRLTATGTGITKIEPSGCEISCTGCGIAPTWDVLTSAGTTSLSDTWYNRSNVFDEDYTSATGEAWCDSANVVTVKVTATSMSSLTYWFTDDSDCWF